ncbi:ArsR/SmtB family transcription factor [Terriglobus tenax]|uniref:ArsR/SmtB family transcription factor n=1 Tax=Terriglobus tenax TaxID=1111115 RepID=UPI0021E05DBE|nr:metalloregulator ArsR/SmtB family transcription factor [Terriglobus tenax]
MVTRKATLTPKEFARIGRALAEPRRVQMLKDLAARESCMTCGELQETQNITPPTLSHHIKELEVAGLIEVRREGRCGYLSVNRDVLKAYLDELSQI